MKLDPYRKKREGARAPDPSGENPSVEAVSTEALEAEAAALGAPLLGGKSLGRVAPMLCAPSGAPLAGAAWLYELKLDGVRIVAEKRGREVTLTSRTRKDVTATYPEVARAVQALAVERAVLDGEVVAFDDAGHPSFQRVSRRIHLQREADVRIGMNETPVQYFVFDLLALGDRDLRPLPLLQRKALLAKVVPGAGLARALDYFEDDGAALLAFCRAHRLEGAVAKRKRSPYRVGPARSGDWVKIKCERDDEFVIVGWTRGEGGRARLGALDLATYDGGALRYRGKVGTGFDERTIDLLLGRLGPLATRAPVASGDYVPAPRGRTHVRPELVASVGHMGFSDDGQVRHAVFRGLRDEVPPRACTAGPPATRAEAPAPRGVKAAPKDAPAAPEPAARGLGRRAPSGDPEPPMSIRSRRVAITNPNKVLWPGEGLTKGDLCRYYEAIAPAMLPHLKDRPLMLVRYPDGIGGKFFYQWNAPAGTPPWIRTCRIQTQERGAVTDVLLADGVDALLHVANLGAIAIHVLAGRVPHVDECDFATIDFDVELGSLDAAVVLARALRELLETLGLEGFPKTSGQSGLHVLVPLGPGVPHEAARALADLLGRLLVLRHPDIATMERVIAKRGRRVYVDTGQTGRSRTIVAPYSVRAQPGATVSTPLRWDEVAPGLDAARFDMRAVPARVAEIGDPMAGLLAARPELPRALTRLEALVREAAPRR